MFNKNYINSPCILLKHNHTFKISRFSNIMHEKVTGQLHLSLRIFIMFDYTF